MSSFLIKKLYSGDGITKNTMGGACGKYGKQERFIQGSDGSPDGHRSSRRGKGRHRPDCSVSGWALLSAVLNLGVPYNAGNFLTS
jgi:hypothetical protein